MFLATSPTSNIITILFSNDTKNTKQQKITGCDSAGREECEPFALNALIFHLIKQLTAEPFKVLGST